MHGYADADSVVAGRRIAFHLSSTVPHRAEIVRLGTRIDDPEGDEVVARLGEFPAVPRAIHPGSYVHVARRIRGTPRGLSLEVWIRPWAVERLAGVITQEDKQSDEGFALGIGPGGYVGFFLGNGTGPDEVQVHRTAPGVVRPGVWQHVVAAWDGRTKTVWVDGREVGRWDFAGPFRTGRHPLRLGAMGEGGEAVRFLDADIALPVVRSRGLTATEVGARWADRARTVPRGGDVLAVWGFSEETGGRVADSGRHRRHGRIVNLATWMIGGPAFQAEVARFGDYEPGTDPDRGHGLRLASDDLHDCRWPESFAWRVPSNARPGVYAVRLRYGEAGRDRLRHLTFLVRSAPGPGRPRPRLLVVCSTSTWRAYNGAPFGVWPDSLHAVIGTGGLPNAPGDPPAFCFYRPHAAGQGTYQLGRRMPWPAAEPYVLYGGPTRYSHLMRAERHLHAWLDREGIPFDVAADVDLHRDPDLFRRYAAVVLNGHSEYWSVAALDGLRRYLGSGGNLAVLSGNSLFWRVSFDSRGEVMECRKVDAPGDQLPGTRRGEAWHSQDGRRGGMLRECGYPGWDLVGLETLGWNNQSDPANFGPYRAVGVDHPLFHKPHPTGLGEDEAFGFASDGVTTLANGHEFDIRLSTLRALQREPSPPGAEVPADPPGIVLLARGVIPWAKGGAAFDYFFRPIRPAWDQGGEMIWWERPAGGRVFHAGSIGSGWALYHDPKFQALFRNVLARFEVAPGG